MSLHFLVQIIFSSLRIIVPLGIEKQIITPKINNLIKK